MTAHLATCSLNFFFFLIAHSPNIRLRVGLPAKLRMSRGPDVGPMSGLMWAPFDHVTWSHGPDVGLTWVSHGPVVGPM